MQLWNAERHFFYRILSSFSGKGKYLKVKSPILITRKFQWKTPHRDGIIKKLIIYWIFETKTIVINDYLWCRKIPEGTSTMQFMWIGTVRVSGESSFSFLHYLYTLLGKHPPGRYPSSRQPPAQCILGYTPPVQCMLGYTPPAHCMRVQAGGTHPTGMHSCWKHANTLLRDTTSTFTFSRCYRNVICLWFEYLYSVASFKTEHILVKIKIRLSKIDTIFTFSCAVETTLLHFIWFKC